MSVNRFHCPECQASLKTPEPVPSGKKIRCPKCKSLFTIPGPEEEDTVLINADGSEEQEADAAPQLKTKAKKKKLTEEGEPPTPPRKKAKPPADEVEDGVDSQPAGKPAKNKRTLLLACGGVALVLIIVLLVVFILR